MDNMFNSDIAEFCPGKMLGIDEKGIISGSHEK